ncbi:hypothetical protein [Streptomyces sp. NPDC018347]|uniref:hypothetical protein n=1 Tax=Streptomyces sp. NPDC018347 TaxID=3157193 RepID=UPI0033C7BD4B
MLDWETGVLAPRFDGEDFDASGEWTLEIISPLNDESTVEGRRRSVERYTELADLILKQGDATKSRKEMKKVILYDEFGLAPWFAFYEGAKIDSFAKVRAEHPPLWRKFSKLALNQSFGISVEG